MGAARIDRTAHLAGFPAALPQPSSSQGMTDAAPVPLFELRQVRKRFGDTAGVVCADLEVRRGEIHAIVGANGSGKSTLARIISGLYAPDAGELRIAGVPVHFASPRQAQEQGIVAIDQEPQFVPDLTVSENIFLGAELTHGRIPILQRRQMQDRAAELLRDLGAPFEVTEPLARLGLAERQLVAIARALSRTPVLCVLDEPTAPLGSVETGRLFAVLRRLRARGAGIVYISHQLDDVLMLADRVTILRDGHTVQSIRVTEITRESLISQFIGYAGLGAQAEAPRECRTGAPIALQVEQLSRRNVFENISFQVAAGEIYGLAGLTGSGRTRIARGIFGAEPLDAGSVRIYGRTVRIQSPRDAIKAGIGMLPEDRILDGLILCQPANENVALPIWERIAHAGVVTPGLGLRIAARLIAQLGIRAPQRSCAVGGLSGGNQQKIVIARWFAMLPKVLILDEPTRGVDVAAKAEICGLIRYVAAQGIGMLVICSEVADLLTLADRVGVVRQGHLVAEFSRQTATEELVLHYALGSLPRREPLPDPQVSQEMPEQFRPWPAPECVVPSLEPS